MIGTKVSAWWSSATRPRSSTAHPVSSTPVDVTGHTGAMVTTSTDVTGLTDADPGLCCAPLARAPLSAEDAVTLARTVKAIADPARLRLLSLVAASDGGEACVCDLVEPLALSQPTVSHHLKVLVDAGLLDREKRGVWAYYSLVPAALDALAVVIGTPARAGGSV